MTLDPMRFALPMPPNIANGSHGHWRVRHREKLEYWHALDVYASPLAKGHPRYLIPRPPAQPFARATISSVMHLGAAMDDSNAMRRHKWVEDWLVTRGYLADDRKKCLTWTGFPVQVIKRDGNYRLVLTITPLSEAA